MDLCIWKFPVAVTSEQVIEMPVGANILSAQTQGETPCIWAMVDPRLKKVKRQIQMAGTGHDLGYRILGDFIGTVQTGPLVWHYFDGGERI